MCFDVMHGNGAAPPFESDVARHNVCQEEPHLHGLGVASPPGAHSVVAGRLDLPLRVAHRRLHDAWQALVRQLQAPEAAAGKGGNLQPSGCKLWRHLRLHLRAECAHDGRIAEGLQYCADEVLEGLVLRCSERWHDDTMRQAAFGQGDEPKSYTQENVHNW